MNINDFNFSLPEESIAQMPKERRSDSKLLVINRSTKKLKDEKFENIYKYMSENDLLVVNDTKVIPARIIGFRKKNKR